MRLKIDLVLLWKFVSFKLIFLVSSPLKSGSKETWSEKSSFLPSPETKGPRAPGPGSVVSWEPCVGVGLPLPAWLLISSGAIQCDWPEVIYFKSKDTWQIPFFLKPHLEKDAFCFYSGIQYSFPGSVKSIGSQFSSHIPAPKTHWRHTIASRLQCNCYKNAQLNLQTPL